MTGDEAKPPAPGDDEMSRLLGIASRKAAAPSRASLTQKLVSRAAVLGAFAPGDLTAGDTPSGELDRALREVLEQSVVVVQDGARKWLLDPAARSAALAELGDGAAAFLESTDVRGTDEISKVLSDLIHGILPDTSAMSADELRLLVNAAEWCAPASRVAKANLAAWRQQLERRELLVPLEAIVGAGVVGRRRELDGLRDYVGGAEQGGISNWIANAPLIGGIANALPIGGKSPYVVHGVGGIGKSTLMAQFMIEHAAEFDRHEAPYVYLDFDRALLDPVNALSLLSETARQVGVQIPRVADATEVFRRTLQQEGERSRTERRSRSKLARVDEQIADRRLVARKTIEFMEMTGSANLSQRTFLLVLDTFEDVQAKGDLAVGAVFEWLQTMAAQLRSLRVVIAGRAPIEGQSGLKQVSLGDLDRKSALKLLEQGGLQPELSAEIRQQVGGNPLSLHLAIRLARTEGDLEGFEADKRVWLQRFRKKLTDLQVQGVLYSRLLRKVGDERVQKLANPGLVVRRITVPVIQEVLAPLVGLGNPTDQEAKEFFDGLRREVTLVRWDGTALVHRKDVRSVMLPLQRAEDEEQFMKLHAAAAAYYERQGTPMALVEHIYHRLMLGENPVRLMSGLTMDVVRGLASGIDDFPPGVASVMRVLLGKSIPAKEVKTLPPEAWELYAFGRARDLVEDGAAEAALDLLSERTELEMSPLLAYPRALACLQLLEWERASASLELAATSHRDPARVLPNESLSAADLLVRPWIERGFLEWYRFNDLEAGRLFEQARELVASTGDRILAIEAELGHALVFLRLPGAREVGSRDDDEARQRVAKRVSDASSDDWRASLSTLRRVVFLGFADARALADALQLLGLRLRSNGEIQRFLLEFEPFLTPDLRARLAVQAGLDDPHNARERSERGDLLTKLEEEAGGLLARVAHDLRGRPILDYLRGRFAPWRFAIRSGILSTLENPKAVDDFVGKYFPEVHRLASSAKPRDHREYTDYVVEAAEEHGAILLLLQTCIDLSEVKGDPRAADLLFALRRYTGEDPAKDKPPPLVPPVGHGNSPSQAVPEESYARA